MKRLVILIIVLCCTVIILPTLLVVFQKDEKAGQTMEKNEGEEQIEDGEPHLAEQVAIPVYRSQQNKIETVSLESYVAGVVASEMPADFELEALKAQALAARTYIVKQLLIPTDITLPEGAVVTDTMIHQVYQNDDELKQLWGQEYEAKMQRIKEAVRATRGELLTYGGEPITASFFSTSNGYTENSEDYWENEIPYLRSVESHWDQTSPRFQNRVTLAATEFESRLGVKLPADGSVGTILNRTDSNRVSKVSIGGKELTGRQVREKLDLDSTDFQWEQQGNQIVIDTKGWGHGVGMSQYGADGMAKEGYSYKEIIHHYYKGISISSIDPYVGQLLVALNNR